MNSMATPGEAWRERRGRRDALRGALALGGALLLLSGGLAGLGIWDGLLQTAPQQSVTGVPAWDGFCPEPASEANCLVISGMVALPDRGTALLTVNDGDPEVAGGTSPYGNGVILVNESSRQWEHRTALGCWPGAPFYPGVGITVYFACEAFSGANASIIAYDAATGEIAQEWSTVAYAEAFGFDPSLDLLYVGFSNGTIAALDPGTGTTVATQAVAAPGPWALWAWSVLYDPLAGVLVTQTGTATLELLDPSTLDVEGSVAVGTQAWATLLAPTTGRLYVATAAGSLLMLSATTLRTLGQAVIDPAACSDGDAPFWADTMVLDPTHGDLYLIGFQACAGVLNLTTEGALTTLTVVGDGPADGLYDPATNSLWLSFWLDALPGPGMVVALHQSSAWFVSRLLWLPGTLGILAVCAGAGLLVAIGGRRLLPLPPRPAPSTTDSLGER